MFTRPCTARKRPTHISSAVDETGVPVQALISTTIAYFDLIPPIFGSGKILGQLALHGVYQAFRTGPEPHTAQVPAMYEYKLCWENGKLAGMPQKKSECLDRL